MENMITNMNNPGIGNNTFKIKMDKSWLNGRDLLEEQPKREYSQLTYEKLRNIIEDMIYKAPLKEKKIIAYTGDGKGNLVPIEESPMFHEAMKKEAKNWYNEYERKLWYGEYKKEDKQKDDDFELYT